MEEMIEQAKHEIAILTENVLYSRINALNDADSMDEKMKNERKDEMIETFVASCAEQYEKLSPEQIKEHVVFVLNRTIENIKKLKEESGR